MPLEREAVLREELASDPRHASSTHTRLARVLGALGEKTEAVETLRSAVQLGAGAPEDYEALAFGAFGLNGYNCRETATPRWSSSHRTMRSSATIWRQASAIDVPRIVYHKVVAVDLA